MRKAVLWLFAIALIARAIIALLQVRYGIDSQVNLDRFLYGPFNDGFELYHDFYGYYVSELIELSKGLLPYKDFGYSYPPLFLYSLYPFFLAGGKYFASIPILLADICTAPMVFLIARRFTSQRISFLAGLSYALSPFFLLYEGYLWYSSQPMTFFILLSLYLLMIEKPVYSSVAFAIAVLFKQETIFILPVYLIWYYKEYGRALYKGLITLSSILFAVSLPFLITSPFDYISAVSYATIGSTYTPLNDTTTAITTAGAHSTTAAISQSLNCLAVSSTWRSLVCNYNGFTYTDVKSVPPLNVILTGPFLNTMGPLIALGLFATIAYYLYLTRKDNAFGFLCSALALMIFVAAFNYQIHTLYRYYEIPVYALILASCKFRNSVIVAALLPLASLFLPSGSIELIPPLISLLAVLIINYNHSLMITNVSSRDTIEKMENLPTVRN
jgi:hypothetical protein